MKRKSLVAALLLLHACKTHEPKPAEMQPAQLLESMLAADDKYALRELAKVHGPIRADEVAQLQRALTGWRSTARRNAAHLLAESTLPEVAPIVRRTMIETKDVNVWASIWRSTRPWSEEHKTPAFRRSDMITQAYESEDMDVFRVGIDAAILVGRTDVVQAAKKHLDHSDSYVRQALVVALREVESNAIELLFRERLDYEVDTMVIEELLQSLVQSKDPATWAVLLHKAERASPERAKVYLHAFENRDSQSPQLRQYLLKVVAGRGPCRGEAITALKHFNYDSSPDRTWSNSAKTSWSIPYRPSRSANRIHGTSNLLAKTTYTVSITTPTSRFCWSGSRRCMDLGISPATGWPDTHRSDFTCPTDYFCSERSTLRRVSAGPLAACRFEGWGNARSVAENLPEGVADAFSVAVTPGGGSKLVSVTENLPEGVAGMFSV
ncbi:MAG: hypothetical protein HC834_05950, partial [Rhodospirillales bacterium]|nr:hypothetical protein [Rhodospirillales bacterium]